MKKINTKFSANYLFLAILASAFILFNSSCKKDLLIEDVQLKTFEKTNVSGFITDENGNAIGNAKVEVEGITVYTDENGFFIVKDVNVKNKKITVSAEKEGFFKPQSLNLDSKSGNLTLNIKLEKVSTVITFR